MCLSAPINDWYRPHLEIGEGCATMTIDVREDFFHPAGAVHGAVYFKLLDDAAFFAANSLEPEVFVLTTSFTTYLTRPVSSGKMRAEGRVVNRNKSQWIAEAVVFDSEDREIARGSGCFVRSKVRLDGIAGYANAISQAGAD
ncbi:MAG: PaaI family thioesterase [Pseudomonadota bacterium]